MHMWWTIDIKDGKVTYDNISWMGDHFKINAASVFSLTQDLLQIKFQKEWILDVGWYPDLDVKGSFKLILIKNQQWENPSFTFECKDIKSLKQAISKVIQTL